jgi:hypothetical protein
MAVAVADTMILLEVRDESYFCLPGKIPGPGPHTGRSGGNLISISVGLTTVFTIISSFQPHQGANTR